jgi:hypothetical protein
LKTTRSQDLTGTLTDEDKELLDRAFGGRGVLVLELASEGSSEVISGKESGSQPTRVYRCHPLNQAGNPDTARVCAVKVGGAKRIRSDFAGWERYLGRAPESCVKLARPRNKGGRAILVMEFVGGDFRRLSEVGRDQPELLAKTLEQALEKWLRPLHYDFCGQDKRLPCIDTSQRSVLFDEQGGKRPPRIAPKDRELARRRLDEDLGGQWKTEAIEDWERGLTVPNWVRDLVNGADLPGEYTCAMPKGTIHGDLNFRNIYVSVAADRRGPVVQGVAVIDYERCREGYLFDDLARIECELLFSTLPVRRVREIHSDTALTAVAASWSWHLGEGAPAGLSEAERAVFGALRVVRARAIQMARDTGCDDLKALERGYFACVLGRAFSYLWYPHVLQEQRPRVLDACLLLAQRLSTDGCEPPRIRFSDVLEGSEIDKGEIWGCDSDGYWLDGRRRPAMLRRGGVALTNVHIETEITITNVASEPTTGDRWLGLALGARGFDLAGRGVEARISWSQNKWRLWVQPLTSSHPQEWAALPADLLGRPIELRVDRDGSKVVVGVRSEATEFLTRQLTFLTDAGELCFVAQGCLARVQSFRAHVPDE